MADDGDDLKHGRRTVEDWIVDAAVLVCLLVIVLAVLSALE